MCLPNGTKLLKGQNEIWKSWLEMRREGEDIELKCLRSFDGL